MKFLNSGKVKDVYDMGDDTLLFNFSNRVSAYDVKFQDEIPKKGEVLCKFAKFWFDELDIDNHFVKSYSDTAALASSTIPRLRRLLPSCGPIKNSAERYATSFRVLHTSGVR